MNRLLVAQYVLSKEYFNSACRGHRGVLVLTTLDLQLIIILIMFSYPQRYRPARLDLHESGIIGNPFNRTSTAICSSFLIFGLEYLIRVQSSEPLHAKMNPTSCLFGSRFAQNPDFLLAGALSFDEKTRQSAALFQFGLRNVVIFYIQAAIQRTIDASPVFMEYGLAKKIAA